MNKRSAIAIATGLVAALVAGVAAFSISFGAPGAPAAADTKAAKAKPIVRTVRHTVTIHKKAKASDGGAARVVHISGPAPSAPAGTSVSGSSDTSSDDAFEEGGVDDDQLEGPDDSSSGSSTDGPGPTDLAGSGGGDD